MQRGALFLSALTAAAAIALTVTPAGGQNAAPSPSPIPVPVEVASNVFFARVTVNGVGPFWFTVDTGATLTVIDPSAAARAKLAVQDAGRRGNVGIAAGDMTMATTTGARINVAGLPIFAPPTLYVVAVQNNAAYFGHAIDGVLGTDFLSPHIVALDYGAGRVSVLPPARTEPAVRQGAAVTFTLEGNVLVAPATITLPDGERVTARLLIDTGSNGALTLTSPFVRRHDLTARFPSRQQQNAAVGINGTVFSPVVALTSVAFGDAAIARPNAALSTATAGLDASTDFDGIIGAELLRQFTVTIDYPRRRLIFSPPAPSLR
ncbi:MAG TPA: retropepsin-like aspartic protease [Vicinamibacterales bacterium]|nr:retropepsin-like aspartic protease [Vicinamibacterales bacterium]